MAKIEGSLRRGNNFRDLGIGESLAPQDIPEMKSIVYSSWIKGIVVSASPEDTPELAAREMQDLVIDRDSSIIRAPGIILTENAAHALRWIFEQASLDYSTELIAIAAPYLGYKSSGIFTWVNLGIGVPGVNGWNAVNILGYLLFSDGSTYSYTRNAGAAVVTDVSADIIARTFGNAFGRTFAGAFTDGTGLQGLGVKWNSTSGIISDFAGVGSGEEILISNSLEADKVVALRPIGLDALAILCRKSLWLGLPTGQADRPADFRINKVGLGCVAEPTAVTVPGGVAFLSDEGMQLFNQNGAVCFSEDINSSLLPIDYTQLSRYRCKYTPVQNRLVLQTPSCTWVYEFPSEHTPGNWTKRSFALDNIVVFTDQSGNLYWFSVIGTWAAQTLTWAEMVQSQDDAAPSLFFTSGTKLGQEDETEDQYLGVDMDTVLETGQKIPTDISEQITTLGFEIEYSCTADAEITLVTPNSAGDFTNSLVKTLTNTIGRRRRGIFWGASTGQGIQFQYKLTAGFAKLYRIKQIVADSGPQLIGVA